MSQPFTSRDAGRLLIAHPSLVFGTLDSGKSWTAVAGAQGITAVRMFTQDSGYLVLINYADSTVRVRYTYGEVIGFFDELSVLNFSLSALPHAARILTRDSIVLLSGLYVTATTDRGQTWITSDPFAGIDSQRYRYLREIVPTSSSGTIILRGGEYGKSDFFISRDFGVTWKHFQHRFRDRLARMAAPSSTMYWALVLDTPSSDRNNYFENFITHGPHISGDTLLFSSDSGQNWVAIERFLGDTISHLVAGDNGQVHVMHFRNGKTYISTFTPEAASVQSTAASRSTLRVYPNPSSTSLNFTLPVDASLRVTIVDMLGRTLHHAELDHDNAKPSTLEYPGSLMHYKGPLMLIVDGGWFRTSQMILKY